MHIRTSPNSTILIFNNFSAADFSYGTEDWSLAWGYVARKVRRKGNNSILGRLRDGENVKM